MSIVKAAKQATAALRIAELGPRLAALGHSVVDTGDLRHPVR